MVEYAISGSTEIILQDRHGSRLDRWGQLHDEAILDPMWTGMWTCSVLMVLIFLLILSLFFVFVGLHFNRPSVIKHHVIALVRGARQPLSPFVYTRYILGRELAACDVHSNWRSSQWGAISGRLHYLSLFLLSAPLRLHIWIRRVEIHRVSITSPVRGRTAHLPTPILIPILIDVPTNSPPSPRDPSSFSPSSKSSWPSFPFSRT